MLIDSPPTQLKIYSRAILFLYISQEVCDAKFSRFSANHTACLERPSDYRDPRDEGITPWYRRYIVNLHNNYRANVYSAKYEQPEATNMQKMVSTFIFTSLDEIAG